MANPGNIKFIVIDPDKWKEFIPHPLKETVKSTPHAQGWGVSSMCSIYIEFYSLVDVLNSYRFFWAEDKETGVGLWFYPISEELMNFRPTGKLMKRVCAREATKEESLKIEGCSPFLNWCIIRSRLATVEV